MPFSMRKPKPTVEELVKLPPNPNIKDWVIIGIDPSLSRTGLAVITNNSGKIEYKKIMSIKPEDTKYSIWVRSSIIAKVIQTTIKEYADKQMGLILSLEQPTPSNDYLNVLNRIILLTVLTATTKDLYRSVYVMHINAATLRSCLELKATGNNKHENIRKAQEFVDASKYPGIDSDSCDGVLMGVFGSYAAELLQGRVETVPVKSRLSLADASDVKKGKGRNERVEKRGILHNPVYWMEYTPKDYGVMVKDARIPPKKRLEKTVFNI